MRGPRRAVVLGLATAGGAGLAPIAPGTVGAAVGVALYAGLAPLGPGLLGALALALLALGVWASGEAERVYQRSDDGRIVIDEVVGQLIGLTPLLWLAGPASPRDPLLLGAGFLAFRLFDVWKPGPVRWAERRFEGGWGVMLDDVLAGGLTALVVGGMALASRESLA